MTLSGTDPLALAHDLLCARVSDNRHDRSEDPDRPETVQAMQIALHVPKADPPRRTDLLAASARAVVAVCLDERVATDSDWREGLTAGTTTSSARWPVVPGTRRGWMRRRCPG